MFLNFIGKEKGRIHLRKLIPITQIKNMRLDFFFLFGGEGGYTPR